MYTYIYRNKMYIYTYILNTYLRSNINQEVWDCYAHYDVIDDY